MGSVILRDILIFVGIDDLTDEHGVYFDTRFRMASDSHLAHIVGVCILKVSNGSANVSKVRVNQGLVHVVQHSSLKKIGPSQENNTARGLTDLGSLLSAGASNCVGDEVEALVSSGTAGSDTYGTSSGGSNLGKALESHGVTEPGAGSEMFIDA